MNVFAKIFRKRQKDIPLMPTWDAVVDMMYDRQLDSYADKVLRVTYSKDKSMRYVILRNENGLCTYRLEAIYQYNPEEWVYLSVHKDPLPAMWEPIHGVVGKSVFENIDELLTEMEAEPEYKRYFV